MFSYDLQYPCRCPVAFLPEKVQNLLDTEVIKMGDSVPNSMGYTIHWFYQVNYRKRITWTNRWQEAEKWFYMVSSDRVSDKRHRLSPDNLKKCSGIKSWKLTPVRFPPPLRKSCVWPSLHETILRFRDRWTAYICILRTSQVLNPVSTKQVTSFFF
jgi:hypothetical protein